MPSTTEFWARDSNSQNKRTRFPETRKGKIKLDRVWRSLCNTTKNLTLPFKSDFANEMASYLWYSYMQARNLPYKNVSIVFSSPYNIYYNI